MVVLFFSVAFISPCKEEILFSMVFCSSSFFSLVFKVRTTRPGLPSRFSGCFVFWAGIADAGPEPVCSRVSLDIPRIISLLRT
jgi:hypothetical protein